MPRMDGSWACDAVAFDAVEASRISIVSDPGLKGEVRLVAEFDSQDEFDAVTVVEGRELVLKGKAGGGSSGGNVFNNFGGSVIGGNVFVGRNNVSMINGRVFVDGVEIVPGGDASAGEAVSLTIEARVPVGFPVRIVGRGRTEFVVDTGGGMLVADLKEGCRLKAEEITAPRIKGSGESRVTLGRVGGGGSFEASGGCKINVGQIEGGSLACELSGSAAVSITAGRIQRLDIDASGAARLSAAVLADEVDIDASGACRVEIAEVIGRVAENTSGVCTVIIRKRGASGAAAAWWENGAAAPEAKTSERRRSRPVYPGEE